MSSRVVANPGAPIFLLGFARSGTTWMALALRDYLDIGMVNEGTFITSVGKRYAPDKPVRDPEQLVARLKRDEFCRILERAYQLSIDWQRVRRQAHGATYAGYIQAVLADIAEQLGRRFIGSKSPAFGRQIEVLLRHFPQSSIIHVIRDGRDVALSHYQRDWGRKNAYAAAVRWQQYITSVRKAVAAYKADYHEIYYEDLLREPARHFERIAEFVLAHDQQDTSSERASDAGARFAARIKPGAFEKRAFKWKHDMTARDVAIFNATAGTTLYDLGYEANGVSAALPAWQRAYYQIDDRLRREWNHKKKKLGLDSKSDQ